MPTNITVRADGALPVPLKLSTTSATRTAPPTFTFDQSLAASAVSIFAFTVDGMMAQISSPRA